jgi:hypothetical protein
LGEGCTVGEGRVEAVGVVAPASGVPLPQATSTPGSTPAAQSDKNSRRSIFSAALLAGLIDEFLSRSGKSFVVEQLIALVESPVMLSQRDQSLHYE